MTKRQHKLVLMGGSPDEVRVKASTLKDVIEAMMEVARAATRFYVDGVSQQKGARPAWLDAACDMDILGLAAGSLAIAMEAPPLREVDPVRFGDSCQMKLLDEAPVPPHPLGDFTVVDIVGQLMAEILANKDDEIVADGAVLDSCARLVRAASRGYSGIQLHGVHGQSSPVVVRQEHIARIERLRDATPPPQTVRVSGKLDSIVASRPDIRLLLADGTSVICRVEDHDIERLRALWGTDVVVSGTAHFGPTRRLLRIEVKDLSEARPEDRLFQQVPKARTASPVIDKRAAKGKRGVAGFFGTWPGDESEVELVDALTELK